MDMNDEFIKFLSSQSSKVSFYNIEQQRWLTGKQQYFFYLQNNSYKHIFSLHNQ